MKKYCDTNLNYYIKIKLTEEGRIIYKKHYAKYNCEALKLNIDDEGYVRFQIHDFMNIFGERLFMGVTLPCETNCKIQVKDEWHYVKDGDLPKDDIKLAIIEIDDCGYLLCNYRNGFWYDANSGATCAEWITNNIIAWKEIIPPKGSE